MKHLVDAIFLVGVRHDYPVILGSHVALEEDKLSGSMKFHSIVRTWTLFPFAEPLL